MTKENVVSKKKLRHAFNLTFLLIYIQLMTELGMVFLLLFQSMELIILRILHLMGLKPGLLFFLTVIRPLKKTDLEGSEWFLLKLCAKCRDFFSGKNLVFLSVSHRYQWP